MVIRTGRNEDRADWLRMRTALWNDCPVRQLDQEIGETIASATEAIFFAVRPGDGLYATAFWRPSFVPRPMAAEARAQSRGCRKMASNAELWNAVSHEALGYEETPVSCSSRRIWAKQTADRRHRAPDRPDGPDVLAGSATSPQCSSVPPFRAR